MEAGHMTAHFYKEQYTEDGYKPDFSFKEDDEDKTIIIHGKGKVRFFFSTWVLAPPHCAHLWLHANL
jgi:hypothetical protein